MRRLLGNETHEFLALGAGVALLAAGVWYGWAHQRAAPANRLLASMEEFKRQPGGALTVEAGEFLIGLAGNGKLPGFSAGEHGRMQAGAAEAATESYPVTRSVHFSKAGDASDYFYVVVRDSEAARWRLVKATRMSADGQVLKEYVVP